MPITLHTMRVERVPSVALGGPFRWHLTLKQIMDSLAHIVYSKQLISFSAIISKCIQAENRSVMHERFNPISLASSCQLYPSFEFKIELVWRKISSLVKCRNQKTV